MLINYDTLHPSGKAVLLLTPFHRSQRGNSLTSERIQTGLKQMGINIDLLSLEDKDWERTLHHGLAIHKYSLVHGFHGLHFARVLNKGPDLHRLPLVLTMTGTDINYDLAGKDRDLVLQSMRIVKRIIVFNQQFEIEIAAAYPEFQSKLQLIPQGVCLEDSPVISREELGLQDKDFIFILPSGLREVKNIDLALDALSELWFEYREVRLLIMGAAIEEDYSDMILQRMQDLPWVSYLGEIPHNQVKAYYQLADVVLNTSLAEGQPQAALEVMSLSIPAILTAVPGNLGIIEHGVQGFYAGNKSELLEAAQKLILDNNLKQVMGRAAAEMIQLKFQPETEFNAHAALYQSLLA